MMSPYEKHNLTCALRKALEEAEKMPTTTPCTACVHFRFGECAHWKQPVPSEVLEGGCEEWRFDPFSPPF